MNKEERFAIDNLDNIIDFQDDIVRLFLPQREVVKLLNSFYEELKKLRRENKRLKNRVEFLKQLKGEKYEKFRHQSN